MSEMFRDCDLLELLDLSNFDTSSVTDMYGMFFRCESLKSLDISHFNTSLVNDMSSMFYGCSSLQTINLSNFDTSLVTNMDWIFYNCSSLQTINLSNFNTSLVTDMAYMFYDCSSLQLIDISNFDLINCTSFQDMFTNTYQLKYLDLYNFKNRNISISALFTVINTILFVCQKDEIIINQNIYNCCDYNLCISNYIIITELTDKITYETTSNETDINIGGSAMSASSNSSSSSISIGIIIGIIAGVVVLIIITVIIIYKCKKKKVEDSNSSEGQNKREVKQENTIENNDNTLNNFNLTEKKEDKPEIKTVTIILMLTNQEKVKIRIDPNKKMKELIKFYFQIIKKPELYDEKSIAFLINGVAIEHRSEDLIKNVINLEYDEKIILIADTKDKINLNSAQQSSVINCFILN